MPPRGAVLLHRASSRPTAAPASPAPLRCRPKPPGVVPPRRALAHPTVVSSLAAMVSSLSARGGHSAVTTHHQLSKAGTRQAATSGLREFGCLESGRRGLEGSTQSPVGCSPVAGQADSRSKTRSRGPRARPLGRSADGRRPLAARGFGGSRPSGRRALAAWGSGRPAVTH
ncbi:hypothetical protein GUJ93_ZPchr0010g10542 [Zizania palustris]|uniref:Uncharacterized protein n=1 Tax=Zizania palustris TaxID=103762 RepID=A0A8J5T9R1_ZIZPA|nr:hypothetical protein GUJ93_ZPchr0010g10542 [Zizania palustris]